jgi:hypothetical protein
MDYPVGIQFCNLQVVAMYFTTTELVHYVGWIEAAGACSELADASH